MVIAVMAKDEADSLVVAKNNVWRATKEVGVDAECAHAVNSLRDLHSGWNGDSVPYGADGNANIKSILGN